MKMLIREYIAPNGVKVRIHDDYCARTPQEKEQVLRRIGEAAYAIYLHEAQREAGVRQ